MNRSANDLLTIWFDDSKSEHGLEVYKKNVRQDLMEELVKLLIKNNIDEEEADMLRYKLKTTLVTLEGQKGKGVYKGWKENVEKEWIGIVYEAYEHVREGKSKETPVVIKDYGNYPYMPENPIITAWAKEEYGPCWTNELNLLVHMHGHRFNQEFQSKVMDSNWAKSGENMPEWAEKLFKT